MPKNARKPKIEKLERNIISDAVWLALTSPIYAIILASCVAIDKLYGTLNKNHTPYCDPYIGSEF